MRHFMGLVLVVGWVASSALGGVGGAEPVSPAKVLAEGVAAAERQGYRAAAATTRPALELTAAERQRGLVLFNRNVNLRVYPTSVPEAGERVEAVYVFGAPGETVSAQVALRSLVPMEGVTARATDLAGPGGAALRAGQVVCRWVEYAPVRGGGGRRGFRPAGPAGAGAEAGPAGPSPARGEVGPTSRPRFTGMTFSAGGRSLEVVPLRIRSPRPLDLPQDWTQAYWLTIRLPEGLAPGRYEGHVAFDAAGKELARLPLVVTVLPITLADLRSMFFGAFLMVGGLPDGPNVHSVAQLKDLADRNIHGILWFWGHYGLAVRRMEDGSLKMDFARLDEYMSRVQRAGIKGPVVLALGNDSRGHLEQAIGEIWDLPLRRHTERPERAENRTFVVATLDCPQLDALYVEALRQLLEHAREMRWPEIVLLPYDEPTERLEAEYRYRAALIKKHFPDVRIYGVVMGQVGALSWLGPVSDILVTNGNPGAVRTYAQEHGKTCWTYGGRVQAGETFGGARIDYGLRPWSTGTQAHWFWAYNWHVGDPMNEFDGERGDAAWVVAYPPERPGEACLPSPAFEGMRAGVDDVRYAEALQALLDRLPAEQAKPYRDRLDALRSQFQRGRGQPAAQPPRAPVMSFPTGPVSDYDAYRLGLVQMILEVQGR